MKTLAEINAILGTETAADLTQIIGAIKAAVRESGEGVIADLEAKLASDAAAAVDAATALAKSNASELAKLTASHAEAIAAKDEDLAVKLMDEHLRNVEEGLALDRKVPSNDIAMALA